jgi:5'-3' exonuclease
MGIPGFFKWIADRCATFSTFGKWKNVGDNLEMMLDTTLPNPNGIEFENLFLDLNGVIHAVSHPEGRV